MRSPEKCGYSVGKLCPTAKLCMIAVFGPKSLYSGLEMCSLPSLELKEANIIQDTRTTYPAISTQSAMLEPLGRGRYGSLAARISGLLGAGCTNLVFHLDQNNTAITAIKNNRLPHRRGCRTCAKASAAKYVNQELTSSPTIVAAAHRCKIDTNL